MKFCNQRPTYPEMDGVNRGTPDNVLRSLTERLDDGMRFTYAAEYLWLTTRRPYYSVYPAISEMLLNTTLALDSLLVSGRSRVWRTSRKHSFRIGLPEWTWKDLSSSSKKMENLLGDQRATEGASDSPAFSQVEDFEVRRSSFQSTEEASGFTKSCLPEKAVHVRSQFIAVVNVYRVRRFECI